MKFLAFTCLLIAVQACADDDPLTINGCLIAESSQCPGADLRGALLANQDLAR